MFGIACNQSEVSVDETQEVQRTDSTVVPIVVPVDNSIQAYGVLSLPPDAVHQVYSKTDGYVSEVGIQEGWSVQKGQLLAELTSPEFSVWKQDYAAALIQYVWQQKHFERNQKLYAEHAISEKEFQLIEKDYLLSQSIFTGWKNRLLSMGFTEAQLTDSNPLKLHLNSPCSGVISFVNAVNGMKCTSDSHLFTVLNTDTYQMQLQVSANDIHRIHTGTPFYFIQSADTISGSILFINQSVNEDNSVHVIGKVNNHKGHQFISGQKVFVRMF